MDVAWPTSRRASPNSAHSNGTATGAPGPSLKVCLPRPDTPPAAAHAEVSDTGAATRSPALRDTAPREVVDRGPDLPDPAGLAFTPSAESDPAEGPETELVPDSALEPVVSANATDCIDATAAPTPTATATAPIRPR